MTCNGQGTFIFSAADCPTLSSMRCTKAARRETDDPDWPDFIEVYTGVFTYYGDNKKPGFDLHDTPRRGNKLLQSCFAILHNAPDQRVKSPPFLVFTKGSKGRDVVLEAILFTTASMSSLYCLFKCSGWRNSQAVRPGAIFCSAPPPRRGSALRGYAARLQAVFRRVPIVPMCWSLRRGVSLILLATGLG